MFVIIHKHLNSKKRLKLLNTCLTFSLEDVFSQSLNCIVAVKNKKLFKLDPCVDLQR